MAETYAAELGQDEVAIEPPIPVFRMFDVDKAMEFYRDFLGFTVDWEHRFEPGLPLYCQVSRSGIVLHLSEHSGDATPGACAFVPVRGVKALHAELIAQNYRYMRPGLKQAPWGLEVAVTDPFGNRLIFCEREIKPQA
jgi:catechol 2,3-dioxygenase-like lactoylglutathione lyase family enzyme